MKTARDVGWTRGNDEGKTNSNLNWIGSVHQSPQHPSKRQHFKQKKTEMMRSTRRAMRSLKIRRPRTGFSATGATNGGMRDAPVTRNTDCLHVIFAEAHANSWLTDQRLLFYVANLPHHENHLAPHTGQDGESWVINFIKVFLIYHLFLY